MALSARGHYLHLASARWVKRLASGALLLIIGLACAVVLPLVGIVSVFIINLAAGSQQADIDAVWWGLAALAIVLAVVCIWLFVRGLLQLTTPEPGAKFRGEGLSARRLVRYCLLALAALPLGGIVFMIPPWMFGFPFPTVAAISVAGAIAYLLLPLALLRHVMALMRRIPRPGLVTFAKIEFWGGLVSGIVYIASHALMMFVSFRAIAPLAGGAGMPMTPYAGGPNSPGMAATASAPALTSLGYTSTTVTYIGPGGTVTTAPASMPTTMTPPTFGPAFFLATTVSMVSGCGMLIVGIAGLVLLILVWRALANAARLAEQNALPNNA